MLYHGCLHKMKTSLPSLKESLLTTEKAASPADEEAHLAQYQLTLDKDDVDVNDWLGKKIKIEYKGNIFCCHCKRKTSKSYAGGYCYPCFMRLAECDLCIVRPEKCHYEQGTCRDNDWAHAHCMQPHVVYLANSSGLKVGITRRPHVPSRWIDQGAVAALPIMLVANRYQSGMIEVALAQHISDRTNWRKMLKGDIAAIDLYAEREQILQQTNAKINQLLATFKQDGAAVIDHPQLYGIRYPVLTYPTKITSLSLDKTSIVEGIVQGIKGQYLLLDGGVINIRKFTGYEVSIEVNAATKIA